MQKQDLSKLQLRKLKAFKRKHDQPEGEAVNADENQSNKKIKTDQSDE